MCAPDGNGKQCYQCFQSGVSLSKERTLHWNEEELSTVLEAPILSAYWMCSAIDRRHDLWSSRHLSKRNAEQCRLYGRTNKVRLAILPLTCKPVSLAASKKYSTMSIAKHDDTCWPKRNLLLWAQRRLCLWYLSFCSFKHLAVEINRSDNTPMESK